MSSGGVRSPPGLAIIGAADDTAAPRRRPRRPNRTPVSEAEDASTQLFLQNALGLGVAAARSLTLRTQRPSFLQLSTCRGWVTYLTHLGGGDVSNALAIIEIHPGLLDQTFDQKRQDDLDQLQQCLLVALDVRRPQLFMMVRRQPHVLFTALHTMTATAAFLLAQHGGDTAAAQHMVLAHPQLLTASLKTLQKKIQGRTAGAGLRQLGQLGSMAFNDDRCVPRSEWLLQQGFSSQQALRLTRGAPQLLGLSTDVLQRRLDYFTHACGIPADGARQMLAAQPSIWWRNAESRVMQLKLQYWQEELGYSLSDLPLAGIFLLSSLVNCASRHSVLRDLLGSAPTPRAMYVALIPSRVGAAQLFARKVLAAYVKQQHGIAGSGSNVQVLLQPLSARLSQAVNQEEWVATLQASPPLASAGCPTPQHRQLYAALDSIAQRDWPLSAHGQKWTAAAAEAAAADRAHVVTQRDADCAARERARASEVHSRKAGGDATAANTAEVSTSAAPGASASTPTRTAAGATGAATAAGAATVTPPASGATMAAVAAARTQATRGRGGTPRQRPPKAPGGRRRAAVNTPPDVLL